MDHIRFRFYCVYVRHTQYMWDSLICETSSINVMMAEVAPGRLIPGTTTPCASFSLFDFTSFFGWLCFLSFSIWTFLSCQRVVFFPFLKKNQCGAGFGNLLGCKALDSRHLSFITHCYLLGIHTEIEGEDLSRIQPAWAAYDGSEKST